MSRAERAIVAAGLRAEGLNGMQIAERMGISKSYTYSLLNDPNGTDDKARKDSYGAACVECGTRTSGNDGRTNAPDHCRDCHNAKRNAEARERAVEKLRAFAAEHGRAPTASEWRVQAPVDTSTVQQVFGSWTAGLEAAGLTPKLRYAGDRPEVVQETVELYRSGLSMAEVGARLGCTEQAVFHRLKTAGEPRRDLSAAWEMRRERERAA